MLSYAAYYRARETAREDEINGLQLATFSRRAAGFGIDFVLIALLRKPVEFLWENYAPHQWERHTLINPAHVLDVIVLVLYFCLALYIGNGQALERSLGYGASFLEGGLGFAQFFIQRNRQCAHDRLAETIVIDASKSTTRRVDLAEPELSNADRKDGVDPADQTVINGENGE
jgi:uncharacterized RDD family membrane protein YckC